VSATPLTPDTPAREVERRRIHRALISVHDKQRLEEIGGALVDAGVTLVSTGSTAARLAAAGLPVTPVEDVTGFPECFDGRVKTLHPHIHAGLLADLSRDSHRDQLDHLGIAPFDLVVSNLYPFSATVAGGASPQECIEQIDIGGPALVRAAAKNFASIAVVTGPRQYDDLMYAVAAGGYQLAQRQRLAAEAFAAVAAYDVAVAAWTAQQVADESGERWPRFAGLALTKSADLRYGENAHQPAALYVDPAAEPGLAQAEQLHGKAMSFNNYIDAQAAHRAAADFDRPAVAVVKHANPCGIAVGADIAEAHAKAHACDPVSAYGGVVAANREVTEGMAEQLREVFTEVVVAPSYTKGALEMLTRKKNVRILRTGPPASDPVELRAIPGGALLQVADRFQADGDDPRAWRLVSGEPAPEAALRDLAFAWRACRAVKSNAIVLAAEEATVGVGMGQVNRLDAARLAVARAGDRAVNAVGASDAFFPFPDGLQILIDAGVRAVVQPGGSVRDDEVVKAARSATIVMYFTGARHFAH
jgi:phosphoribosylaminoimidazolecarboxamide formyltransferase/IMP cyclohydrolase